MKYTLAVFLALFAVTTAQRGLNPLNGLKNTLDQSKSKLENTIDGLTREKRNLESRATLRINDNKYQGIKQINDFTTKTNDAIKAEVDKAKAEGKDARKCLEEGRTAVNNALKEVYQGLDGCAGRAQSQLTSGLQPLDNAVAEGNRLMGELNSIFPSCFGGNTFQMTTCIATKLGMTNQAIRAYEGRLFNVKSDASRAANNAPLTVMSCSGDLTRAGFAKCTDARIAANRCIEAA